MRRSIPISTLLLTAACLPGCGYPIRASESFRMDAPSDGVRTVSIETRNGEIELRGDPAAKRIDIHGEKYARGVTMEDAIAAMEQIEIEALRDATRPDQVRIETLVPASIRDRSAGAKLVVTAPPGSRFELNTTNGSITIASVDGPVHADTSNGHVRASDVRDSARLETSNGGITLQNVGGDVDVHTSNGNIRLKSAGRARVSARTTNGYVTGTDLRGAVTARSSNGGIDLKIIETPPQPEICATTSNGPVRLELPPGVDARLTMRTSNGGVYTELKDLKVSDFRTGRNRLEATLNNGGGNIEVVSSNGSVTVSTRDASTSKTTGS